MYDAGTKLQPMTSHSGDIISKKNQCLAWFKLSQTSEYVRRILAVKTTRQSYGDVL